MKVKNYKDIKILQSKLGTILEYDDGSKEQVIFKTTDVVNNYYLTQIQTNNIKKNGQLGKLTSWLKIKHYTVTKEKE